MLDVGIHPDVPETDYHGDPCVTPSLTRSLATVLCQRSPAHAWAANPRLNPDCKRTDQANFDLGTAAHEVFLGGQSTVELIYADDYRTKDAKILRDQARAAGKIPMLEKQWPAVVDMVTTLRQRVAAHKADPPLFRDGLPEVTLVWNEVAADYSLCRARPDWLRDDYAAVDDLKTTASSVNPYTWGKTIFSMGYDIQAELYSRGVEQLTGRRPLFRFVVVETSPPFAVSVFSLAPDAAIIARKKVDYALGVWARCLARDEWPAYSDQVAYASLPPWEEAAWLEKEERELGG